MGYHNGVAKTGFIAVIDRERCNACGACIRACNIRAIDLPKGVPFERKSDRYAVVADKLCLGCGACISTCKQGALSMIPATGRELTPLKRKNLYMQILKEKKRLTPFVVSGVKKSLRNLLKRKTAKKIIPIIEE
jgi:NAD-dependent dihydropyrimidine dehydrogenase PreA subunit